MTRQCTSLLTLVAVCAGLFAASGTSYAADTVTVRLNWLARSYTTPHYVAGKEKGYYAAENLDVTIRPGTGSGDTVKLIAAGQDTIGQADAVSIIQARTQGIPVRAIMAIDAQNPFVILASTKSGIKTLQDLPGHTSGVIPSSSPHWIYKALLKKNNIDESKIREVTIPPPGYAPLLQGAVDFISLWDTSTPVLQKAAGGINVIRGIDNGLDIYGTMIFVSDQTLKDKADVIKRFLRATAKGMQYTREHPDEVARMVAAGDASLKADEERDVLDHWMRYWVKGDDFTISQARMAQTQDLLLSQGIIPSKVDVSQMFTNDLVPR